VIVRLCHPFSFYPSRNRAGDHDLEVLDHQRGTVAPILEVLLKNEMGSSEWSTETLKEQQQTEYRKECQQKEMILGKVSSLHNHNADQSIHNFEHPQTSLSGKPSSDEETEQVFTTAHVLCKWLHKVKYTHIYITYVPGLPLPLPLSLPLHPSRSTPPCT
jgi:hypothetical protein